MAKVFVVQEMPQHDISPALRYGTVELLLPSNMRIAFSTAPAVRKLRSKLREYQEGDYLLLTGDPVAIGMACAILSFYSNGRFMVLKWDRREHMYIPVKIDTTEKGERDEY